MDLLKLSTDWAKDEVFSAKIVWLFSLIVLFTASGFWYLGRTPMAKAFVWPLLISGVLLITIGAGLYFANQPRIALFEKNYTENPKEFIDSEIARTSKSVNDFEVVFKVLPILLVAAALLIFFVATPTWRAIGITIALLVTFLMVVDSNTATRNATYLQSLKNLVNNGK